jgi:hypothetical protein
VVHRKVVKQVNSRRITASSSSTSMHKNL